MEIAAVKVPYQVFGMLRDHIRNDLKECIQLEHKPSEQYLANMEECIRFIEAHDKYTQTKRIHELLELVKTFQGDEVAK